MRKRPMNLWNLIQKHNWSWLFTKLDGTEITGDLRNTMQDVLEKSFMFRSICCYNEERFRYELQRHMYMFIREYQRLADAELRLTDPLLYRHMTELYSGSDNGSTEDTSSKTVSQSGNNTTETTFRGSDISTTKDNDTRTIEGSNTTETTSSSSNESSMSENGSSNTSTEDSSTENNSSSSKSMVTDMPQSMVDDGTSGLDASLSWKYASNSNAGSNSSNTISGSTSANNSTDTRSSTNNSLDNSSNTSESSSSSTDTYVKSGKTESTKSDTTNSSGTNTSNSTETGSNSATSVMARTYSRETTETGSVELLQKYIEFIDNSDAFAWIVKKLDTLFFGLFDEEDDDE